MSSPGKYEFRETKLPYTPQSLKGKCLNYSPERLLKLIRAKYDEVVQRITDSLSPDGHQSTSSANPIDEGLPEWIAGPRVPLFGSSLRLHE
jgi:hypothetical protein